MSRYDYTHYPVPLPMALVVSYPKSARFVPPEIKIVEHPPVILRDPRLRTLLTVPPERGEHRPSL